MNAKTDTDLIGYDDEGNPIWAMFGAEGEDDAEDTEAEGGEDDADAEDDSDDGEQEEETVDSLKLRLAKADAALKKANKEAERLRLKQKNGTKTPAKKAAAADEGNSEAEEWKARAIRSDAKAALLGAGFTGDTKAAARLIRTIDTDELEFDGDDILGLDDAIDSLRETFPALFKDEDAEEEKPKATARRRPKIPVADKGGKETGRKKTPSEIQAEMLFGGR